MSYMQNTLELGNQKQETNEQTNKSINSCASLVLRSFINQYTYVLFFCLRFVDLYETVISPDGGHLFGDGRRAVGSYIERPIRER